MAKPRDSESVPFSDGKPIEAAVLYKLLGDSGDEERVDGPKPADSPSSSGGKRDIEANPDERSHLQQLEDLVASEFLWDLIEKFEEFHNTRRPTRRRGRKRGYNLMDIQILETGTHLYDNPSDVQRNLRNDRKNWKRLRRTAKKAFPNNKSRRLSKTAPSRHQVYRACRDYFSGDALAEFRRWYRRTAVQIAKDIGIFDPKAGSWTHPHKSQSMVGDMTWMRGATQFHRDKPFIPGTGKARRFDPHADYHHTSDGKPTKVPGRELVMLSCRTGYGNERIPTDAEFMPRKKSPLRKGRNEADQSLDMLERLLVSCLASSSRLCGRVGRVAAAGDDRGQLWARGGDGRRFWSSWAARSARRLSGGLAARSRLRLWRCGAGSCWPRPRAATTRRSPLRWGAIPRRWPSGASGSLSAASTGSATTRGRARRAPSTTRRSRR